MATGNFACSKFSIPWIALTGLLIGCGYL
jgi:hypothetical protein